MADFPYLTNAASLRKFFAHVQSAGVSPKVTQNYLESVGFKSKSDRAIVPVLRTIGFIDGGGTPNDNWRRYRNKQEARRVMAGAVRTSSAYKGLFDTYPDAYRRDAETLRNYFSSNTNVGERAQQYMVATFRALAELGDFEGEPTQHQGNGVMSDQKLDDASIQTTQPPIKVPASTPVSPGTPSVTINIELTLPATDDASVYEKLFAAMRKNLFPQHSEDDRGTSPKS